MKPRQVSSPAALWVVVLAFITVMRGSGSTQNFTYDEAGRLVSANYNAATNLSYAYDPAGNLLLASAPRPAIIATPQPSRQVTLSWPALPAGYVLQSSPALGQGESWSNVNLSQQPAQIGNLMVVTLTIGPEALFFRLRH